MPIENKIYQNSIHFYGIHFEHNPQYIFSFQVVAVVLFLIPFYRRLKYHVEVQNAALGFPVVRGGGGHEADSSDQLERLFPNLVIRVFIRQSPQHIIG